ncbi:hypothetical protein GOB93_01190 [Acetobacter musti]|uniref:Alpha 1,4-glycosyltransferase domain-containing protein n=1 Tax=Acetobacter musti TaxID=864732 RepID=A0ABX0JLT7_9PROT|nr:hypothetical protein [Acetobacter musti]NHN83257.1 hypothetical protein [Acetobacter musti]
MSAGSSRKRHFGTFWYGGQLSALEQACANSVLSFGYDITIFSYSPLTGLPPGVTTASAGEILPEDMTRKFFFNGKPDTSHFSDLFRYEMIRQKNLIWVDLDMLMLSELPRTLPDDIVVREEQGNINGAILYLSGPELTEALITDVKGMTGRNLRWGETGPLALTRLVSARPDDIALSTPATFYPIGHNEIFKVFLPDYREECRALCAQASMMHLYNNILVKMGYWKDVAPPTGSFLHDAIARTDGLKFFRETYPVDVMKNVISNYHFRLNGKELGIKSILREAIPSVRRTYRHYRPT